MAVLNAIAELAALVDGAADAMFVIDARGTFVSANAATLELLGRPRAELIGCSLFPFLEVADQSPTGSHVRAAASGACRRTECRFARPDGSVRMVAVSMSPLRAPGDDATPGAILCVARDATGERTRAAALERAEARYTRLVASAEDGIATLDEEGHVTSANRALQRAVGHARHDLIGTHFADLVDESQHAVVWRAFTGALAGDRTRTDLQFTHADGRPGFATLIVSPVTEWGRISGVLVIARDVSEERMLLGQVVNREKLAALGELVGSVAHEINTPLTGILAFAQILAARPGGEDARRAADAIAQEAKRAAHILAKLLTFARQSPSERLPTDINQVVEDACGLRRYAMRSQGVTLDVELARSLPVTWADPAQLQQVFLNLLLNAEQALLPVAGERRITIRSGRDGDELRVTVEDSGHGIAPEHLPHIFNPFYTTKPRGIGTGLGLSISHGIVREHDGSLRVHSEPGRGALFEVCLPLVSPPQTSPTATA